MLRLHLPLLFIALSLLSGCTIMLNPENGGAAFPSNGVAASEPNPVPAVSEPAAPVTENPPTVNASLPPVIGLRPDLRLPQISTAEPPKAATPPVRQIGHPTKPVQVCRECVRHAPPKAEEPVRQQPPKTVKPGPKRIPPRPSIKAVPSNRWTPTRLASL